MHEIGVELAVVIGGGNYFRGRMAQGWGISRAEADNIGMLGTVMNALMLRGVLTARCETDVRVMTAMPMQSVAEPFIRLRADRHLRDPNVDPDAKRFTSLTYSRALAAGIKVMDPSAFVLANEQGLLMHVFDVAAAGAMKAICLGEDIGTRISADEPVASQAGASQAGASQTSVS